MGSQEIRIEKLPAGSTRTTKAMGIEMQPGTGKDRTGKGLALTLVFRSPTIKFLQCFYEFSQHFIALAVSAQCAYVDGWQDCPSQFRQAEEVLSACIQDGTVLSYSGNSGVHPPQAEFGAVTVVECSRLCANSTSASKKSG